MTTKDTVQGYLDSVKQQRGWESFLSDGVKFTSFISPVKQLAGKPAYIEATKRFYSKIASLELRDLIIDADRACALTRYQVQGQNGSTFTSDVAEVFTVKAGKIDSLAIYFDTAPYGR